MRRSVAQGEEWASRTESTESRRSQRLEMMEVSVDSVSLCPLYAEPTPQVRICLLRPTIAVASRSTAKPAYTSGIPADSAASDEPM